MGLSKLNNSAYQQVLDNAVFDIFRSKPFSDYFLISKSDINFSSYILQYTNTFLKKFGQISEERSLFGYSLEIGNANNPYANPMQIPMSNITLKPYFDHFNILMLKTIYSPIAFENPLLFTKLFNRNLENIEFSSNAEFSLNYDPAAFSKEHPCYVISDKKFGIYYRMFLSQSTLEISVVKNVNAITMLVSPQSFYNLTDINNDRKYLEDICKTIRKLLLELIKSIDNFSNIFGWFIDQFPKVLRDIILPEKLNISLDI